MSKVLAAVPQERMLSLDVFRGITITMMIFVNNPGSWSYMYPPFQHASFNGWTPTDFIFPFFVFIMGISIVLAFEKKLESGVHKKELYKTIFNRTWKLFALGIALTLMSTRFFTPNYHWLTDTLFKVRILGVLQRLALAYGITAVLFLNLPIKKLFYTGIGILVFYWLMMKYFPYSAIIDGKVVDLTGVIEHGKNFAAYIDFHILGKNHVYYPRVALPYDPEGIFSTLTTVVSCIAGVITGNYLKKDHTIETKMATIFFWGTMLLCLGQLMDYGFPINKTIWSPSFVVFMAGMALLFLAVCMFIIDFKKIKNWSALFIVFGSNAIAFFVLSGILTRVLIWIKIGNGTLQNWLFNEVLSPLFGNYLGSIMFSVLFTAIMYIPIYIMYKKRIFWKV